MDSVELREFLKQYCEPTMQEIMKYDRLKIKKPARFKNLSLNMDTFNTIMDAIHSVPGLNKITRTKSGAIKKGTHYNICAYDVQLVGNSRRYMRGLTLTVILGSAVFLMKFGAQTASDDSNMTGKRALHIFEETAKSVGIDMSKYEMSFVDGLMYSQKLTKLQNRPMVWLDEKYAGKPLIASHLDMHKSYMSFLCARHPEFFKVATELTAKYGKKAKPIFVCAIGMMHSVCSKYKYAKLAVDAICDNNAYLRNVIRDAYSQKFAVVLANTDGLVLVDKTHKNRLYHNAQEGPNLCQWSYDYQNTYFRADSARRYIYFDRPTNSYKCKWSGVSRYEQIKPRQEWNLDDYLKALTFADEMIRYDEESERLYKYEE